MEMTVAVVLPALLFVALYLWRSGASFSDDESAQAAEDEMRSKNVRAALAAVERVTPLSDAIFRSADFASLIDYTPEIATVDVGRANPFSRPEGLPKAPPPGQPISQGRVPTR